MSTLKPIKIWGKGGPNPPKIPMILEEIGNIPYEIVQIPLTDIKGPEYTAINPNGRLPAIYDPNTDLTLWESGAIIEYLVEKYDTQRKISFEPGSQEAYHAKQWLFYQVSGQGPYYGQAVWFNVYHPEKLPSAKERYINEIKRVNGVLEGHLEKQKGKGGDGPWLVGGKFSYADLAFLPWQDMAVLFLGSEGISFDDFPNVKDWVARMKARPALNKVLQEVYELLRARGVKV
ncbi:glutathione transferase 2 [Corynespora cassiicola Philippines]|uniref:Glutathione transferase 2 n=1 Tax=Corynespora cassiicola Philippines TaxID=1448308 RepID=A0A2T2NV73_CORCC|nr:glutathione transferase 2 [Corynespora cassiicola Philippines]